MKKGWILLSALLLFSGGCSKADVKENRNNPSGISESEQKEEVKDADHAASVYEQNMDLIERYIDAVYVRSSDDEDQNVQEKLRNIVNEDLLDDYAVEDASVDETQYQTRLTDAEYYADKNGAAAIFRLKSITDLAETEQVYLLEVRIEDERIDSIERMETLHH